jgi:hypothetical protein
MSWPPRSTGASMASNSVVGQLRYAPTEQSNPSGTGTEPGGKRHTTSARRTSASSDFQIALVSELPFTNTAVRCAPHRPGDDKGANGQTISARRRDRVERSRDSLARMGPSCGPAGISSDCTGQSARHEGVATAVDRHKRGPAAVRVRS